ncbi:RagB/SusD family nutrient uptake outer membrane protein [Pedobacter hiemivivus]|uniref:RagB/SusD family nutrient uptake outer membrane protein n=1 Tax=Pedobacter hiemivivus TaxID=2530454 RepID=A0A4U1GL12_9SPHI|nr:RagB/SusD family nutrient uptake outer membrane protein [Pedobacter hiemivivus]TKC63663.1 RagB/SusD family nutrient uptake outer membrane protein [Pedobacter hiemivivus]
MKKYIICLSVAMIFTSLSGCKKFLDVESITALSGNKFWSTQADVESFTNNLYAQLWAKFSSAPFISSTGELRSGEILPSVDGNYNSNNTTSRVVYRSFGINDLKTVLVSGRAWTNLNFASITRWLEFYQVIQGSNIMYDKVDRGIPGMSDIDTKRYKAEAVFIRCFTYFYMVRLFGDVAYYTDAYHSDPIGRENFVSVLNKCIAELAASRNDLPWKYEDAAFNGFRANKGAAIDLLMNMNMWNAGFDQANKQNYYATTQLLGQEIVTSNAYSLVPLSRLPTVMEGGTEEGLFAFKQGVDFGTPNKNAFPGEILVAYPQKGNTAANGTYSNAYFRSSYINKIYNLDEDDRLASWFVNPTANDGIFSMKKFAGSLSSTGFPDWAIVMFRYADAILLRAEAAAELGMDQEAVDMLNLVRDRAGASLFEIGSAENLKDAIFRERQREFIGEGYSFFDLVRTRKITDGNWTSNPLTLAQFNEGAWTWPIDASALTRNPFMTLNSYWL